MYGEIVFGAGMLQGTYIWSDEDRKFKMSKDLANFARFRAKKRLQNLLQAIKSE